MRSSDRHYHVIRFQHADETDAFVRALQRFLGSPRGSTYIEKPGPCEVWAPHPLGAGPLEAYLSDDALAAARAAFSPVPVAATCSGDELRKSCVLLLTGSELSPPLSSAAVSHRNPPYGS